MKNRTTERMNGLVLFLDREYISSNNRGTVLKIAAERDCRENGRVIFQVTESRCTKLRYDLFGKRFSSPETRRNIKIQWMIPVERRAWIKTFPLSSTCKRRRIPVDLFYSRMNQLRDVKPMESRNGSPLGEFRWNASERDASLGDNRRLR